MNAFLNPSRLAIRYVIPFFLVYATIVRPETKLSKRVSHLFFGHLSAPCSCGEGGSALGLPHECPTMQTAMLKAAASEATTVSLEAGSESGGGGTEPPSGGTTARNGKTTTNGGGSLAHNGRTTLTGEFVTL